MGQGKPTEKNFYQSGKAGLDPKQSTHPKNRMEKSFIRRRRAESTENNPSTPKRTDRRSSI
jgi:hypothetical protein